MKAVYHGWKDYSVHSTPEVKYVIHIREEGTDHWGFGFVTPLTGCGFENLKPNTKYEVELRSKNIHGLSPPVNIHFSTDESGGYSL